MLFGKRPPQEPEHSYIVITLADGCRLLFEQHAPYSVPVRYVPHTQYGEKPASATYLYGLPDEKSWCIDSCELDVANKVARVCYADHSFNKLKGKYMPLDIACAFLCSYAEAPDDLVLEYRQHLQRQEEKHEASHALDAALHKLAGTLGDDFANYVRRDYAGRITESLEKEPDDLR